jgi:hypothetical protein
MCSDGQEALDRSVEVIKESLSANRSDHVKFIKPISLMLIDF